MYYEISTKDDQGPLLLIPQDGCGCSDTTLTFHFLGGWRVTSVAPMMITVKTMARSVILLLILSLYGKRVRRLRLFVNAWECSLPNCNYPKSRLRC